MDYFNFSNMPRFASLLFGIGIATTLLGQTTVSLSPIMDNSIFSEQTGNASGAGRLYIGQNNAGNNRRALLQFDLSSIPAGSVITSVSLSINVDQAPPGSTVSTQNLHPITTAWGEGLSNGSGGGGVGATAVAPDATWLNAMSPSTPWLTAGGDFTSSVATVSLTGSTGTFVYSSTTDFIALVQSWVDDPLTNFGVMLVGDESTLKSARRIGSREMGTAPSLQVTYCSATSNVISVNACDSFIVPSKDEIYTTLGSYTVMDTIPNSCLEDSIITINLTLNASSSSTDFVSACDSVTWIDGITYTSNNTTATHVLTNAAGCDSIVTLNLTITPSSDPSFNFDTYTYCVSGIDPTPTISGTSGGIFSGSAGLVIDSASGVVDLDASGADQHMVTYSIPGSCASDSTIILSIVTTSDATFDYTGSPFCASGSVSANFDAGASSGLFSATPLGIAINPINGTIDLSASSAGTYTITNNINASGSCMADSHIDSITILAPISSTINESICEGDSIVVNGTVYDTTVTGITEIFTNAGANGCDSIVTININLENIDLSVASSNDTLTSNQDAASYQWINCNATIQTIGDTNQHYTPTSTGSYAVIVTKNGCTDTSTCVNFTISSIPNSSNQNAIAIYPNPSNTVVNFVFNNTQTNEVQFQITNLVGQTMHQITRSLPSGKQQLSVDVSDLKNGTYLYRYIVNGTSNTGKLVVQH